MRFFLIFKSLSIIFANVVRGFVNNAGPLYPSRFGRLDNFSRCLQPPTRPGGPAMRHLVANAQKGRGTLQAERRTNRQRANTPYRAAAKGARRMCDWMRVHRRIGTPAYRDTGVSWHRCIVTLAYRRTGSPAHRRTGTLAHRCIGVASTQAHQPTKRLSRDSIGLAMNFHVSVTRINRVGTKHYKTKNCLIKQLGVFYIKW